MSRFKAIQHLFRLSWAQTVSNQLALILQNQGTIMATLDDLKAAQDAEVASVATVKADVEALLAKLANIPAAGLTPEQQAALDAAVAQANGINASLGAIDAEVNPPAATDVPPAV